MLKAQNRLSSKFEFNVTRKYGTRITGTYFTLFFVRAKNYEGSPRIGFVVPNKLHKNATTRNKLKRLFREATRKNVDLIPNGFWLVIHPKPVSLEATYENISTDVNKVLQSISFS